VSGYVHAGTRLGRPSRVSRVIITKVYRAPMARSIAPPTAGMSPGLVCRRAREDDIANKRYRPG
jgi:hypothetical protein